ncbi:flippase [Candidatus Uhrbacteria bacterium]|nr:flippase [Candidatus Uhrbacteria bacterium]
MSRLARNTAFLTIASIGQKFIAFVYFALIARIVGVEWTGKYFLALSITTMVGVIADFGLTPVLVRETAKHPDDQQKILSHVLGMKLGLSALAAAIVVIVSFALGYDELTRSLMYVAIGVMILDSFHLTYYGVFRGRHTLGFESIGIFIGQAITLMIGVTSLLVAPNLVVLIIALLGGSLWNVLYSSSRLRKVGLNPFKFEIGAWSKKLLKMAFPFALAAIFVKIYSTTDSILLERHLGDEAVGWYSIAYKLTYAFQFLPMAFVAALYPTFSKLIHDNDPKKLEDTFNKAMWYMMILAVPIVMGISAVAHDVVPLIYGTDYLNSVMPLQVLIFVLFFIFLDFPIGALLNADDRQATKTAIMGGTMIINVVANLILIPLYGILGASIAAVISFAFLFGAGMIAVRKSLKYDLMKLLKIWAPIVLSGIFMFLAVTGLQPYVHVAVEVIAGGAVYVAGLFIFKAIAFDQIKEFLQGIRKV